MFLKIVFLKIHYRFSQTVLMIIQLYKDVFLKIFQIFYCSCCLEYIYFTFWNCFSVTVRASKIKFFCIHRAFLICKSCKCSKKLKFFLQFKVIFSLTNYIFLTLTKQYMFNFATNILTSDLFL